MNLLQSTFTSPEGDSTKVFGIPYSQFVKGDVDFRYYLNFDKKNKLATRLILGTGYAYGNSKTLPYIKQFRSEEHTSELQSLMRISYAVFCLKKKKKISKT